MYWDEKPSSQNSRLPSSTILAAILKCMSSANHVTGDLYLPKQLLSYL